MNVRKLCQRNIALLPIRVNISSGIGTSRTVSRPSSLSRLGHNFLIYKKDEGMIVRLKEEMGEVSNPLSHHPKEALGCLKKKN